MWRCAVKVVPRLVWRPVALQSVRETFEEATIRLENGKTLRIEAPGNSADKPYYGKVEWNGQSLDRCWIGHAELMEGGVLTFHMQAEPDPRFGRAPDARPPARN